MSDDKTTQDFVPLPQPFSINRSTAAEQIENLGTIRYPTAPRLHIALM